MSECREIRGRCYPYLDGELDDSRAAEVEAHLAGCESCEGFYAGKRRLLQKIVAAGRQPAPAALRERVGSLLEIERTVDRRSWTWRRALVPLAAAAALALLLAQPWGGSPTAARAAGFASDHAHHAVSDPDIHPFATAAPAPPGIAGGRLVGLSECVVDGRSYAHYVYTVQGGLVSVYLPVESGPLPAPGPETVGSQTVLSVAATEGSPAAVLVSEDLSAGEMAAL
ncbi:MAG TPA: zf-HC2 domain-containing protein [Gemmatimonadota bacterium]|nr:zf-HC2 domain-containing protein [Gemmatimonadota bacterium]